MRINSGLLWVVALIWLVFLIITVYAPQSAEPVITQLCVQINCTDNGGSGTCDCEQINVSDNNYANSSSSGLRSASGSLAELHTWHNETEIPNGSVITNVTLVVEWSVTADDTCYIEVYNGTWEIVNTTCLTTEDNYIYNLNNFIDNETEAENIQVRINYTSGGALDFLKVDHIYVNVTYLPPHYTDNFNLTYANGSLASDGLELNRSDTLNASAFWTSDNIYNAYVEHNGTGSFVNYSVNESSGYYPASGNWTNYTLDISNTTYFPKAGNVTVRMHAEDEYGQWNSTTVDHYFIWWGESNVSGFWFDEDTIVNGTSTSLYCNVSDLNSSAILENYNVSFHGDDVLFNYSMTNSSGIATVLYTDSSTSAQNITFKCNITNQSDIYYNESAWNEQTNNLTVTLAPHYTANWNLTYANGSLAVDGLEFNRSDELNASAFWVSDNLQLAYAEHNGTGSFVNYTVDANANWTNYTINLSNTTQFQKAGNITVRMHAEDEYGQWNSTTSDHYFIWWGESQITNLVIEQEPILNGSSTNIYCNVSDINSSAVLENYNVTFYQNDIQFNYSLTNSSGIATGLYTDSSTQAGNITIRCNITDDASLYYNASATNEQYSNLTVNMPSHYTENWNLTYANGSFVPNGTVFTRNNDNINASAFWTTDGLSTIYIEHNGNGSFVNYSTYDVNNWTNYTLQFNNTDSNYTQFPRAGNVTVRVYAMDIYGELNDTPSDYYFGFWGESQITNIMFDDNSTLNGSSTNVYCNVTDSDSLVSLQNYNVTFYQNDIQFNYSLTNSSGIATGLYTDSSTSAQNITIRCNITNDASLYYNASAADNQSSNLSIVTMSLINLTVNHSIYNRGENLTLVPLDSSNNTITNVTWIVNLTKYNETEQTIFSQTNDTYTFKINNSDPVGNYTLVANITKGGNSITSNWTFNVSSTITPVFISPTETSYSVGSIISSPMVYVTNARSENVTYLLNVTLFCDNGNDYLNSIGNDAYQDTSFECTAPASAGTFYLTAQSNDSTYNNTGNGTLQLTATATTTVVTGGGGGGSTTVVEANCTCTDWTSFECGAGGCDVNAIYQTRTCTPSGCGNETRCVASPTCEGVIDFNFTTNTNEVAIEQGKGDSFLAVLENTGDLDISLESSIQKTCCETNSIEPFELLTKEIKEIPVNIYVPLSEQPGQYIITISFFYSTLNKERTVKLNVLENPLITKIDELGTKLEQLSTRIQEYKSAGVNTYALEKVEESIKDAIVSTRQSINQDDVEQLQNFLSFAENNIRIIEADLTNKEIEKALMENKFSIAAGIIISLFVSYLITQILIPFIRLGRDIKKLTGEENTLVSTRIATEKQYFMRKIDEKTFNLMMIQGQEKILKTRSNIRQMKETKASIVKARLTPTSLYRWIKSGPKKLAGKFHKKKKIVFKPENK